MSSICVQREENPAAFEERAVRLLVKREAANCLPLSILMRSARWQREQKAEQVKKTRVWSVSQDGELIGTASSTPPHNLVISDMNSEALGALVNYLVERNEPIPGVVGPTTSSTVFAQIWSGLTGSQLKPEKVLGIYELRRVKFPPPPPGEFRPARMDDVERLSQWWNAFADEIGEPMAGSARSDAEQAIADGRIFLWEREGEIVSMAGWGGATPTGVRIMLVYTPPMHRKQGLASAAVAALSQHMLDAGRRACFLFTDLANPTSNHIYQMIGYEFVAECRQWRFTRSE